MKPSDRGGPGHLERRLSRARELAGVSTAAGEPLRLAVRVLEHQRERAGSGTVTAAVALLCAGAEDRRAAARYPLLDPDLAVEPVTAETAEAVRRLPGVTDTVTEPLAESGRALAGLDAGALGELVATWLDDTTLVDPRLGFWVGIGAGPVLEGGAASLVPVTRDEWQGPACPMCGGLPQVSVIAEESGEFLGGSPRSLVCGRCAAWWTFPRATCVHCNEADPRKVVPHVPEGRRLVRVDACETCKGYVKTFDLREAGAQAVVPLVDDVASLTLDVWAHTSGWRRPAVSLAGV